MIRKLMAGTAMLALMTAGAFSIAHAQTDPAVETPPAAVTEQPAAGVDPAAPTATPAAPAATGEDTAAGADAGATAEPAEQQTEIAADAPTLTPDEPTIATAFMGKSVYASENPDSDNIGEVNDLIIGSDGMITHAVVGVGGFLGIGEKNVSVPFDQLQVVQTGDGDVRLIYAATREQLEAAEAFDRTAFDPEERAEEQQEATAETNAAAGTDTVATGGGIVTAPGVATDTPTATETTATTETETETETAAGTEPPETVTVTTIEPQPATGTEAPATTTEAPATTTEAPAAGTEVAAGTDATTTPVVAGEGGFVSFSADQVRASTVIGQEIYGAENEAVGEVSDLILQEDGKTRAALVDVGGFLGIGEKRVAIPFNEIKMTQPTETAAVQTDPAAPAAGTADPAAPAAGTAGTTDPAAPPAAAQTAATAEPRLTIAMTREQLEQLPAVENQAATNATAEQPAAGGTTADPAAPAATVDPNAPAATGTQTAGTPPAAGAEAQYQPVTQDLTADNLMGSAVFGANDESLGDVGDVVFDPNGEIQAVVVDVGGFLGIGEKPVAVQFDSLNVQKNGDGDIRLMLNASQEQLQNAPAYNADAAAAGQPQPTVQ